MWVRAQNGTLVNLDHAARVEVGFGEGKCYVGAFYGEGYFDVLANGLSDKEAEHLFVQLAEALGGDYMLFDVFEDHTLLWKKYQGQFRTEFIGHPQWTTEDGGLALLGTLVGSGESKLFVRVQSYDESGEHKELTRLQGKRVRVTVEEV